MYISPYLTFSSLISIVSCFKISTTTKDAGCEYQINDLPKNTPLVLSLKTKRVLYPDYGTSFVTLNPGESVQLDCPGGGNLLAGNLKTEYVTNATCECGTTLSVLGNSVDVRTLKCSRRITSVARYTGEMCWDIGKEIEVGLQVRDGRWLQLMTVCFNDVARNVLYSRNLLNKQIENRVSGGTSPSWEEDGFYNLGATLNSIYPTANHRVTINRQVGLPDHDYKYVHATGEVLKGPNTLRKSFEEKLFRPGLPVFRSVYGQDVFSSGGLFKPPGENSVYGPHTRFGNSLRKNCSGLIENRF